MRRLVFPFFLLLAGCAGQATLPGLTPPERAQAWQTHQAAVAGLDEWALFGRISVSTEEGGWNGKLRWRQAEKRFLMAFELPMGIGAARLRNEGGGVVMQTTNGKVFTAPDAESLLYQFIGMHLPVAGLRYWVTGLPQPGAPSRLEYDAAGRLARLRQAGWDIRYGNYVRVQDVDLPRKVLIENSLLNVRLLIDHWRVQV